MKNRGTWQNEKTRENGKMKKQGKMNSNENIRQRPALVAAHQGTPLSALFARDVEEDVGMLDSSVVRKDNESERAIHATLLISPRPTVELLIRNVPLVADYSIWLLECHHDIQLNSHPILTPSDFDNILVNRIVRHV